MIIPTPLRILLLLPLVPVVSQAQATLSGSPLTGDFSRPTLDSHLETTNVVWGDLAVSAIADDNNNDSTAHPIAGTQFYFVPAIAIQETRRHLRWNLGYAPGLRVYLPSSSRPTQLTQSFGGALRWDISKRLAVRLRQDYLRTNDPFQQFGEAPLQSDIGVLNRPPDLTYSTFRYWQLLADGDLEYKTGKHTLMGINGSFTELTWGQHPANQFFINTRTSSASAFLSHQLSARQSIGVQYQILDMLFEGDSHTITQGFFLFDRMVLSPRITFTMFAGPQYSQVHNQEEVTPQAVLVSIPESNTLWSPAAGAMLNWSGARSAVYADVARRVSAGSGLLSSVEMNAAALHVQRKLTDLWTANVAGQVSNEALLSTASSSHILLWNIRAGASREFGPNTHLELAYQHIHQSGYYFFTYGPGNHNRFLLTVERSFAWPVGR